jgi:SAM-dependent methyltransferase
METDTSRKTIAAYDKNAQGYADKFDDYPTYRDRITDFQQKHVPKGAHILDLGCGPGCNISTILERDHTCTFDGVDLSGEFLRMARQRFPRFDFLQQDICDLDLPGKYDVVLASFCIVHLTNEQTAGVMHRLPDAIRDGGCLYLSYMNGEKSGFETTSFSEETIFFNYYQDEFIIDLLERNGMTVVEIAKDEYAEPDGSTTIDTFIHAKKTSGR